MKNALIGFTGFVGSNIAEQESFEAMFNSKNIEDIEGKSFELVVCSGARAEKWRINQEPERDMADIKVLTDHLRQVKIAKLVLISTVDVYPNVIRVDEHSDITAENHGYGTNRLRLEQFCRDNFDTMVVRLPGLFGNGLKKNVIFDLLTDNNVEKIHSEGSYQYYNLNNIWKDICIAREAELSLINFATQPVTTAEITDRCFGISDFINKPTGVLPGAYDVRTLHAGAYGKSGDYLYSKDEVIHDIATFVSGYRTAQKNG